MTPSSYARATRMKRLFGRGSGRALIVAWAHGPLLGPVAGLDRTGISTLGPALAAADGILASPSMLPGLSGVLSRRDRPTLFLLQHWQSVSRPLLLLGYPEGATAALLTVDEAAQYGADGVMTYLYVGWEDPVREQREIEYVAAVSARCRELGILHMVESRAVRDENGPDGRARADLVVYHTRLAAELGADLVKTKWTGPASFSDVLAGCPVPILLAGGAKDGSDDEALAEAQAIIDSGAHGLCWGRNVFQREDPASALDQLLRVVHGESTDLNA